jgi:hypothetical protein
MGVDVRRVVVGLALLEFIGQAVFLSPQQHCPVLVSSKPSVFPGKERGLSAKWDIIPWF